MLIGDPSVGKSSLLVRLTDDRFLINPETTIGVEFGSHIVEIEETGERIKCQCWDTAGSETFRSVSAHCTSRTRRADAHLPWQITRSYYRGAAGALLVYSIADRASFLHIGDWLRDIRQHAEENVSIIMVGNMRDLCEGEEEGEGEGRQLETNSSNRRKGKQRQVTIKEAEAYAQQEG